MSYFGDGYAKLSFPIANPGAEVAGFREAQRGALFAIGAHFTARTDPAIVTMPTGSGKTAVLQATAFLLRATRTLVITPSRLVREQIAADFATLGVLKRIGALPEDADPPRVHSTAHRIVSAAGWEALKEVDVVVATVPSVSSHSEDIPTPPPDLFDLILVDEAHHSPAKTWQMLLSDFPDARQVLFTATPFRRDDREIKARFVYTYDLKDAYRDGVFGHIDYLPVRVAGSDGDQRRDEDLAVARATERKLKEDRAAGLDHRVMVRTDGRKRAKELAELYAGNTGLRLKLVDGSQSLASVTKTLGALEAGHLDGIVCVNMLGEGFDMPRLKIAAIHAPHRSLAVTLQFIGRFARTVGERIGDATFVAPQTAMRVEAERLYASGAVWAEIIPNLSATRIRREVEARETLETFDVEVPGAPDLSDLSLYSLAPYLHVKVYRLREEWDVAAVPDFGRDREIVFGRVSRDTRSSVYVTRRTARVGWSADERLVDVEFDVFIFIYDRVARLLFVCASKRSDGLYQRVVAGMIGEEPVILPFNVLNRALKGLDAPRFYNVGMRTRQLASATESYRMITGPHADEAIRPGDARLFDRGHVFGSATEDGAAITIGLSSASKIWSNRNLPLFELLEWCGRVAAKLHDRAAAVTGSKLDMLQTGAVADAIPAPVMLADWEDRRFHLDPPSLTYEVGGRPRSSPASEAELVVEGSDDRRVNIRLECAGLATRFVFDVRGIPQFAYADGGQPRVSVQSGRSAEDLMDVLNGDPLNLLLVDGSRLTGSTLFTAPTDFAPFEERQIDAVDWTAAGVDVQVEFASGAGLANSIQGWLGRHLNDEPFDLVYWDHGSGEAADFVTMRRGADGGVHVQFYHCKAAGGAAAGSRVADVYEVCGQAVKGLIWCDLRMLAQRIRERFDARKGQATFIRGDEAILSSLERSMPSTFEMVIVQPGIAKARPARRIAEVLAAANAYIVDAGHSELRVIGSFAAGR